LGRLFDYILGIFLVLSGTSLIINYYLDFIKIELLTMSYITLSLSTSLIIFGLLLMLKFLRPFSLLIFGIDLVIFGSLQLIEGIQNIIELVSDIYNYFFIAELFLGGIFMLIGMILLGCIILPYLIQFIALLLNPFLTNMRLITSRNIIRNKRRTQNTFSMIAIGLSFLIAIGIVLDSLDAGVYPGAKLELGGDIQIGEIWNTQIFGYLNMSNEIKNIEHVTEVIPVHVEWISINYDQNISKGIYLFIINTTEYANLHSRNTLLTFKEPVGISISQFIHLLDQENSTLIQYELAQETGIGVGNKANLSFNNLSVELDVVGAFGRMPGLRFTSVDYWNAKAVIISWNTLFKLTGLNTSTYDLLAGDRTIAYWLGLDNIFNDQYVISILKTEIYPKIGVFLDDDDIKTARTRIEEYGGIIKVVNGTLSNILLFALIISLIGLSITMFMSVHQRRREIGILRSIGIGKYQIIKMIFGESFIISLCGLFFGIFTGILIGFIMIYDFPFIYFLPIIFTINYINLTWTIIIILIFTLISSIIPAYLSTKINIIESIRYRG